LLRVIGFQIIAFRIHYFKDYWNLLDLFIVTLSVIDIVIDSVTDNAATGDFSPSVLKVFRILRVGRLLRLVKVSEMKMKNKYYCNEENNLEIELHSAVNISSSVPRYTSGI
jgi:hypothetical protein